MTNQLDFLTQDLTKPNTTVQDHQALFSSSWPLFMFDTAAIEAATDSTTTTTTTTTTNTLRGELFQDILTMGNLSSDTITSSSPSSWNLNQHQVQALPPNSLVVPSFSSATMNISYLPPLIENMDNMVHVEEGDQIALDCLQRQDLMNEWVESQQAQCSNNFLFWENVVVESGSLGAGESNININAPTSSSNLGVSSFPNSSL